MTTMGIRVRCFLLSKPLSFVCTDKLRFNTRWDRLVTEMLIMELKVLLKVLTACEADGEDLV